MRRKKPIILAIESSADETSAAIFKNGKIVTNIIYSQISIHKKTGGIVPELAARAHIPKIIPAINLALEQSKTNLTHITHIAVTNGPGLITSLRIGVDTAKTIALALDKPIIPINHLEGHLLSSFAGKNSQFPISNFQKYLPAIGLLVSGGHTMLVLVESIGKYKIIGETVDDAAGEAFDKIAKILGLGYPGGPEISRLAKNGDPKSIELPRPMLGQDNFNFSFSGLKTAVLYKTKGGDLKSKNFIVDMAASAEQAIVEVLVTKTVKAAKKYNIKTILLGGGVSANQKLQTTLKKHVSAELPDSQIKIPGHDLTGDNAGMIALTASFHAKFNHTAKYFKIKPEPNLRLASWR